MRPTVIRRAKDPGDAKDRARRMAAILGAGLERLLALDYWADASVTTDCPADGAAQETDERGD